MINYESQCPLCGTVQSVVIRHEQPCIECLAMFTYTPTADEVIGAIARMAVQLHERRQTNLSVFENTVIFSVAAGNRRPAKNAPIDDVDALLEIYDWVLNMSEHDNNNEQEG